MQCRATDERFDYERYNGALTLCDPGCDCPCCDPRRVFRQEEMPSLELVIGSAGDGC